MRMAKHLLVDCDSEAAATPLDPAFYHHLVQSHDGRFRIGFVFRANEVSVGGIDDDRSPVVVGDSQDARIGGGGPGWLGHGLSLTYDLKSGRFELRGSLVGVPHLYCFAGGRRRVFATSMALLAAHLGGDLEFDEEGVLDLAVIGFPVDGRTLFRNIGLMPAGVRMRWDGGRLRSDVWKPPASARFTDDDTYMHEIGSACRAAVARMDLARAFLSLTAGLDSRFVLALLTANGMTIPALTLAGARDSVDSVCAADLCRRYGIPHRTVRLDRVFRENLPGYCETASLLSGGTASLGQAHEVHYYASLRGRYPRRLSGNFGNQVGRSGAEGAGMRGVSAKIFQPRLAARAAAMRASHWLAQRDREAGAARWRLLVQQENLWASQAGSAIGHDFATQMSPYADGTVIALKACEPRREHPSLSPTAIRVRDLAHRVFGEPADASFQRRFVCELGGSVATVAVNWGWRPCGGIDPAARLRGLRALADMTCKRMGVASGPGSRALDAVGILDYGDFHRPDLVGAPEIHAYLAEVLGSSGLLDGDLLDDRLVKATVAGPAWRRQGLAERGFLLDLALCRRIFRSPDRLRTALTLADVRPEPVRTDPFPSARSNLGAPNPLDSASPTGL